MDARDVIAIIGLLLLAGGLYFVFWPLALLVPGAILCWYGFVALRATGAVKPDQTDQHQPD